MEYFEKIFNIETGEETIRPFSKKEIDAVKANQVADEAEAVAQAAKETARQAVLAKLGLTPEEAAALLG